MENIYLITRAKTLISLMTLAIVFLISACGQKQEEFNDYSLFEDENTNSQEDSVKEEIHDQVFAPNERVIPEGKIAKSVPPANNAADLFTDADLNVFEPFLNSSKSYCLINEGYATPVFDRQEGSFFPYSLISSIQSGYMMKKGIIPEIEPFDIICSLYHQAAAGDESSEGFNVSGEVNKYGGYQQMLAGAFSLGAMNGYYLTDSTMYFDITRYGETYTSELSIDQIKELIKQKGALAAGVPSAYSFASDKNGYMTLNVTDRQKSYPTDEAVIVGWDDDFPAQFFDKQAKSDGAWLMQSSYSGGWGNKGFYWMSYETPIGYLLSNEVSEDLSDVITYSTLAFDEIRTEGETAVASIYRYPGNAAAIGLYTDSRDTTYTVEISNGQFGDVIASKQVTFKDIGYHTVWLDDPVSVSEFTVVVRSTGGIMVEGSSTDIFLSKAGADNGLPITENAEYMITTTQGRSFVKIDGQWVDMTDDSTKQYVRSNICPNDPFITVMYK